MDSKFDIPLHGSSVNIVRQRGPALIDILQSKFGCVAVIEGVDFSRDPSISQQRGPTFTPEKRFGVTLKGGVQVSVWKADLTDFKVDAVVNAANENLRHSGGLAFALSKAGGAQIQNDSDDYIRKNGVLNTGDAVVCDPGLLPCKKIIHAVGPRYPNNPSNSDVSKAEHLLEKTIKSILEKVVKHNLRSVAIPAISSGIFGYPLPECANTIVKTVRRCCESSYSGQLPKEILLVNHDEPTVKEMEKACSHLFTNRKGPGDAKTSAPHVKIGNVHLTLKKGNIEDQQADVIVNTASSQRDLNIGQISKALLKRAGYRMQQEIYKAPPAESVIITDSYNLQCKQVYHTFCIEQGRDPAQQAKAKRILSKSVLECLWTAGTKHKSIAFPAIGTGALGFDKKESAKIISDAVADFAQKFPNRMDVSFVIYPSDHDTFKAFEERIRYLQMKASDPNFIQVDVKLSSPPVSKRDDLHGGRAPTPHISLHGPSHETTREAERWLTGLLFRSSGTVDIYNNFILHFGEQDHQQLSRLMKKGIFIEEFFEKGHARITVNGNSAEDAVVAGLQVEAMLCTTQKEFIKEEEADMLPENVAYNRKLADSLEIQERVFAFEKSGLRILKVEKVDNTALKKLFDLKKNQPRCSTSPRKMLQRIPAQFCEMVCHIGFHAEYAPPDDPAYGEGIYFAGTVTKAKQLWKKQNELKEEYVYFVEAEVLTGNTTPGRPGLIQAPAVEEESHIVYDSVSGGDDVIVIFSGYQALPKYIITCQVE